MTKLLAAVAALSLILIPAGAQASTPRPSVAKASTCTTVLHIPQKTKVVQCVTGQVVVYRWETSPVPVWTVAFIA